MHRTLCLNWNWMCCGAYQLINPCLLLLLLLLLRKGAEPPWKKSRVQSIFFRTIQDTCCEDMKCKDWVHTTTFTPPTPPPTTTFFFQQASRKTSRTSWHLRFRSTKQASFLDTFQLISSWVFRSLRSLILLKFFCSLSSWRALKSSPPWDTRTHCTKILTNLNPGNFFSYFRILCLWAVKHWLIRKTIIKQSWP